MKSEQPASLQSTHTGGEASRKQRNSNGYGRRLSRFNWIVIGVITTLILAVTIASFVFFSRSQIDSSRYQAVFLSNGQVYFGKLHGYYGDRPYLTNVYYIQGTSDGTSSESTATNENQQLVKLGSEIHAPDNTLILNKPSILFVENLTDEGNVMKLINESESK